METPGALRKRLLRKTKSQLVDEIASLLGRVADLEKAAGELDVFEENAVRRQKAEASLKESEALFEQAARMAHLGHWSYDETAKRLTDCSEEIARFFGVTVEEYIAGFSIDIAEMALVHPDDGAVTWLVDREAVSRLAGAQG